MIPWLFKVILANTFWNVTKSKNGLNRVNFGGKLVSKEDLLQKSNLIKRDGFLEPYLYYKKYLMLLVIISTKILRLSLTVFIESLWNEK